MGTDTARELDGTGDFEHERESGWSLPRTFVGDMRCCRRRLTDEATDDEEDNTDVLALEWLE